jgi:hypothetical protein
MAFYWVRNKKGQVAAEVGDRGISIHDQGLAWKLERLKEAGEPPFLPERQTWDLDALLRYMQDNEYTLEPHE